MAGLNKTFLSRSHLSLSLSFRIGQERGNYARPTLQRPLSQYTDWEQRAIFHVAAYVSVITSKSC